MPDPSIYPALPWSLDAQILLALREQLLADAALRTAFVSEDQIAVLEMAAVLRTESIPATPCLALSILADEERETTSDYGATYTTIVQLALVTSPPPRWGDTADLLRSRIVAQIRRIVRRNASVLQDAAGGLLTEGVTRIQRVQLDATPLPSNLLLTVINIEYRSAINLQEQEVLP
ncbi:MAG TPA: hypothetical protein VKM72_17110 [Thermoanaerobaculia bacterium]|nr:hypothetical protein [Thermoanaerobaculia bacterium]